MTETENNAGGCAVAILAAAALAFVCLMIAVANRGDKIEQLQEQVEYLREEIAIRDTFIFELSKHIN